MLDLNKISKNTKLEIAIEILSVKIANMLKKGYLVEDKEMKILLEEREKMYNGDNEVINKILNQYGPEIKKEYNNS